MFIGRSEELTSLTEYYNSSRYECAVIYGRRRIGKTELISEFVKGKKHIFFTAVEGTYRKNLDILSKAIISGLNPLNEEQPVEIIEVSVEDENKTP